MVTGLDNYLINKEMMDYLFFMGCDNKDFHSTLSKSLYLREFAFRNYSNSGIEFPKLIVYTELPSSVILSYDPMDSSWPMFCHDVRHTGRSSYSTDDNFGIEKWRFYTEGEISDTPIIGSDSTIYFGNTDFYFYAINLDGTLKWQTELDGWVWGSSPSIDSDGTIYVGTWNNRLYAINSDGSVKWKFNAGATIASSPAIAEDGTVYFGTMWTGGAGGKIYAINPNGTEKWRYQTEYHITSDPAIGDDGTVHIGSSDSYLYAIHPNGTLRWRFKTGDEIHGHPSIADDGTIYVGSFDDYLYALYPNGTMKWKTRTGWGTNGNPSISHDGIIYIGADKLYAIYPNGTKKWSFDLGDDRQISKSSPAISTDGTIYIGTHIGETYGGEIIAVNSDGTERWRKLIADDWVWSSPSIGEDGTVYIGSANTRRLGFDNAVTEVGYIHAFGPVDSNDPPNPPTITGTLNGKVRKEYNYGFSSNDPDNNPVYLYIDWGDGTDSGWVGQYASDEVVYVEHSWSERGSYTIKAKAKDEFGIESNWSTVDISMPRYKTTSMLYWFLEEHPSLFPLLRYLLKFN